MKICSNCSFSNDEYQAVCSNCGYMLGNGKNRMYMTQRVSTNGTAIAAMILGIVSMVGFGCLAGIPAIICAKIAKDQIRAYNGQQEGEGFATAGLVLGVISTALSIIFIVFYIFIFVFAIGIFGLSEGTASTSY